MQKTKVLLAVFLVLSFILSGTAGVNASAGTGVMVLNKSFTGITDNSTGVTLVSGKEFMEALGGSFTIDRVTLTASARLGENQLDFRLDDSIAKFNGKYVTAPTAMKIIGYRYMIPAEFTAKSFGEEVYTHTYKNIIMVFSPDGSGNLVYNVMSGDTLWMISSVFGVPSSTLMTYNNLRSSDYLYIGQPLIIKKFTGSSTSFPATISANATLFKGPGFGYSAQGYLKPGTAVTITGKNGDWFKASTPIGTGYLHTSVTNIKQDISDTAKDSTYFDGQIPVDTSKDYVTSKTYTVVSGDSFWSISLSQGVPDYEIAAANGMDPTAYVKPGQQIKIPVHIIPVKSTLGPQYGEVVDWFKEGQYIFPTGKVGKFIDLATGKSFMAKRTMGANHSDTETLTAQDSQIMKDIFGGLTWDRRPFILEVDGRRLAVSVAGMPHAGVDGAPFLQNVDNRSDNWGTGPNYDSISGNGMDGHFDVYTLNCKRHVDDQIDPAHQFRVLLAGGMR